MERGWWAGDSADTFGAARGGRFSRRRLVAALGGFAASAALGRPIGAVSGGGPGAGPATAARRDRRPAGDLDELDDVVQAAMARAGVPGAAVGVIAGGQVRARGYGVTNVDYPRRVDDETLFQVGSITKTYTGTALLRLADRGRLDLDAPLRRYLPDLHLRDDDASRDVTLRHLMTHRSGLPADDLRPFGGGDDALARMTDHLDDLPLILPLGFAPSYSNPGVSLEGRLLEVLTGARFEEALRAELLDPLGMERPCLNAEEAIRYSAAAGHGIVDGRPVVQNVWALPRTAAPSAGLVLSLRDQLRYARFWLDGGVATDGARLLAAESYRACLAPQAAYFGQNPATAPAAMGLHWIVGRLGGSSMVEYNGSTFGQAANLTVVPDRNYAFAGMVNAAGGDTVLQTARDWCNRRFLGVEPPPEPPAPTPLRLPDRELVVYAGAYENPGEIRCDVSTQAGGLTLAVTITDPAMLALRPAVPVPPPLRLAFAEPDVAYLVGNPRLRFRFLRDPGGTIEGFFNEIRFYRRMG